MTGETEQPLMGTKRTKKKSLIGIDPLAWMNDESDHDSVVTEEVSASEKEAVQEIVPVVETEIIEEVNDEIKTEVSTDEVSESTLVEAGEMVRDIEEVVQETKEEEVTDMEIKKGGDDFKLEGPISIADVAELHEQFKTYIAEGNDLEIDCSEVEGVDAAALQLLTAFINEAEKQDNKLIWKEPSDSLQATVLMMGLKDEFKM